MAEFYPFQEAFPLIMGFSTLQRLFHICTLSPQNLHHSCALPWLPSSPTLSTVTRQPHKFCLPSRDWGAVQASPPRRLEGRYRCRRFTTLLNPHELGRF